MSNPPWSGDTQGITLMTDSRDPSSLKTAVMTGVDYGFFATMNMRLLAGRVFDPARADRSMMQFDYDNPSTLVVDEAFVRQIGFTNPLGAIDEIVYLLVADDFQPVRIVGVVENQPLVFAGDGTESNVYDFNARPEQILIRLAKEDVASALQSVQRAWERRAPDQVFEYEFED